MEMVTPSLSRAHAPFEKVTAYADWNEQPIRSRSELRFGHPPGYIPGQVGFTTGSPSDRVTTLHPTDLRLPLPLFDRAESLYNFKEPWRL